MIEADLIKALRLSQGIIRRDNAQPIPLCDEETFLLARALLHQSNRHDAIEFRVDAPDHLSYLQEIPKVLARDIELVIPADIAYNGSWQVRGGVGAFMMLARKWDRFEPRVKKHGYDVFEAIRHDTRREGVIDDVRDLRRYLALVEAYAIHINLVTLQTSSKESAA